VSGYRHQRSSGGRVPDPHRAVIAAAGQHRPAIHGHRPHRFHRAPTAVPLGNPLTGGRVPDPHRAIVAAAGQHRPASHRHRAHRVHRALVAVRFGSLLAELDALNRGLVEIGVLAAEDRARIERLEARVTVIFEMMRETCEALGLSVPEDAAEPHLRAVQ